MIERVLVFGELDHLTPMEECGKDYKERGYEVDYGIDSDEDAVALAGINHVIIVRPIRDPLTPQMKELVVTAVERGISVTQKQIEIEEGEEAHANS